MIRNSVTNLLVQGFIFTTPLPKLEDPLCHENPAVKPDWFFPRPHGYSDLNKQAKALCRRCGDRGACLEYALENNITTGIWGGTLPGERKQIRQKRRHE